MYFRGNFEKEKIINTFTPIKLSQKHTEIIDVLDVFSQKIFLDSYLKKKKN